MSSQGIIPLTFLFDCIHVWWFILFRTCEARISLQFHWYFNKIIQTNLNYINNVSCWATTNPYGMREWCLFIFWNMACYVRFIFNKYYLSVYLHPQSFQYNFNPLFEKEIRVRKLCKHRWRELVRKSEKERE